MTERRYWFPAKRSGWGWGPPCTWQGWLVLAVFVVLLAAGAWLLLPGSMSRVYVAYVLVLIALFTGVCWLTGEPLPRRWSDDQRS